MFIKLSQLGFTPYIVGKKYHNNDISFITNTIQIKLINNFSEIKQNDFDILMVNSDQTWRKDIDDFYDVAFLQFAKNWEKTKFTYGVSFGVERWEYNKNDENVAKSLLKNFTGISVREKNAVELIKQHLGFKAQFVLDPTFLIDKYFYLKLIKNFKSEIINQINNTNFIFSYFLTLSNNVEKYLSYIENILKTKIFRLTIDNQNQVKEFLYGIKNCKSVITDSFHGTVFSIIFKKPFISFQKASFDSRFNSLDEIFNIKNRIFKINSTPPISLLNQPLIINDTTITELKLRSINYLKYNLNLIPNKFSYSISTQ